MVRWGWRRVGVSTGALLLGGLMLWETWHGGGQMTDFLPVLLAVGLHEAGHLTAAQACGVKVRGMRLDVFGARMTLDGTMPYGTEWLIAACGPLANLLSAVLTFLYLWHRGGEASRGLIGFAMASMVLGGINLLPVGTLDGGRMLYCAVAQWSTPDRAAVFLRLTSTICLLVLWLGAGYALIRSGGMLTLFVFSLALLLRVSFGEGI